MKMKKIIAIITALLLLLVSSSCTEEETAVSRRGSEISADKFKAEFTQYSGEGENKTAKLVYPDNFSGIYIGEDNRLYILYTHDKESLMNNIFLRMTPFSSRLSTAIIILKGCAPLPRIIRAVRVQ